MSEESQERHSGHGRAHVLVLGLILLAALVLRMEGIHWRHGLHPDEVKVAHWIRDMDRKAELGHAYPGGYFTLCRYVRIAGRAAWAVRQHWRHWAGSVHMLQPEVNLPITFGRLMNVWLGVLTCLLVYLLVARISRSRTAGCFAAFLMAFAEYHVEHCHYAESDIAMIFMLGAALCLWARFNDHPSRTGFLAAAFVSGFAAGTKYYLVITLLLLLIYAVRWRGRERAWWYRIPSWWLLGLVFFLGGFLFATPEAFNVNDFIASLAEEAGKIYIQTEGVVGEAYPDPAAIRAVRVTPLRNFAQSMGWAWLALIALGLPRLFAKDIRKYWPITLVFPAVFLWYCLFEAAWLRSQECMVLLIHAALVAGLTLAHVRRAQRWHPKLLVRPVVIILVIVTLFTTTRSGIAVASVFGWPDPRVIAAEWLERHEAHRFALCHERYVHPANDVFASSEQFETFDAVPTDVLEEIDCDYALRNASFMGRGILDPRTGERYPRNQRRFQRFLERSDAVRTWKPLDVPRVQATFCGSDLQLRAMRPVENDELELSLVLPQPAVVDQTKRATFYNSGTGLGSCEAVTVDRFPRLIAVGGPLDPDDTVYVILHTEERSADVRLRGFGRSKRVQLDAYDVEVVPLRRPRWKPRFTKYEKIRFRAESDESLIRLPCFLRVAFSIDEAAAICRRLGLGNAVSGRGGATTDGFMLAVEQGDWARAAELEETALEELVKLRQAQSRETADVRIRGLNGKTYDDFAQVRLHVPDDDSVGAIDKSAWKRSSEVFEVEIDVPARAVNNVCLLNLEMRVADADQHSAESGSFKVLDESGHELSEHEWSSFEGVGFTPLTLRITAGRERNLKLVFRSDTAVNVEYRHLFLSWSLNSVLQAGEAELRGALEQYRLHAGAAGPAEERSASRVRFKPFLDLMDFQFDPDTRTLRFEFAALRDEVPPLQLQLSVRRRGGWRVRHRQSILPLNSHLHAGDHVVVEAVLGDAFGDNPDLKDIALGVDTDVRYHAGALGVVETGISRVILSEMARD